MPVRARVIYQVACRVGKGVPDCAAIGPEAGNPVDAVRIAVGWGWVVVEPFDLLCPECQRDEDIDGGGR